MIGSTSHNFLKHLNNALSPSEEREELYEILYDINAIVPESEEEIYELIDLKAEVKRQIRKIEGLFLVFDN